MPKAAVGGCILDLNLHYDELGRKGRLEYPKKIDRKRAL